VTVGIQYSPVFTFAAIVAVVLLPSAGFSQQTLHTYYGPSLGAQTGQSVSWIGDIDHDGSTDFVAGSPWPTTSISGYAFFYTHKGHADVWSGATGAFLFQKDGDFTGDRYGHVVRGVGDLDGDGTNDWIVSSLDTGGYFVDFTVPPTFIQGGGEARAYSGATGALLFTSYGSIASTQLWTSVDRLGDVDGDGRGDVITGFTYSTMTATVPPMVQYNGAGKAEVHSGATGASLWTRTGTAALEETGYSVSRAGDSNSDGSSDFLVLSKGPATVDLVLGGSYATARTHSISATNVNQESMVCGLGDLDGDGISDYAIGDTGDAVWSPGMGSVKLYSGATGNLLSTITGQSENAKVGNLVAPVGDVDLDGVVDLAVRLRKTNASNNTYHVIVVSSGATGELRFRFEWAEQYGWYGTSIDGGGDVNNDGFPELLIGSYGVQFGAGMVEVISTVPTGLGFFGTGTPGCYGTQHLTGDSSPKVGNVGFEIRGDNAPPSSTTLVIVCDAADVAGTDSLGVGVLLHVDLFAAGEILAFNGVSNASFTTTSAVPIPNNPNLVGMTYFAQEIALWAGGPCSPSPLGLSSSAGLAISIQP
jgi:hypothetical protein